VILGTENEFEERKQERNRINEEASASSYITFLSFIANSSRNVLKRYYPRKENVLKMF